MPRPPKHPELHALKEALAFERARYDALVKDVLALKRDGFGATVQYETPPATPVFPPVVLQAIAERSGAGTVERRELERWAADRVRAGEDAEQIAEAILAGADVD